MKQQRKRRLRVIVHRQMERMQLVDVPAESSALPQVFFSINLSINPPV
jgi:hypothetical protein